MCARRFLDLPRVVVLGVRRGVHHHVARLNLSRFFRLRGLPRGWENSYLGGSCGERSGTTQGIIGVILIMWYQSARLITAREFVQLKIELQVCYRLADLFFAGIGFEEKRRVGALMHLVELVISAYRAAVVNFRLDCVTISSPEIFQSIRSVWC